MQQTLKSLPPMPSLRPAPRPVHERPLVVPLFAFQFKRAYSGLYTNRHDKFVLREEHVTELKRVMTDYNRDRAGVPLSASDVVNAALDVAFEHPVALARLERPGKYRDALACEVYRKAYFHFAFHDLLP